MGALPRARKEIISETCNLIPICLRSARAIGWMRLPRNLTLEIFQAFSNPGGSRGIGNDREGCPKLGSGALQVVHASIYLGQQEMHLGRSMAMCCINGLKRGFF